MPAKLDDSLYEFARQSIHSFQEQKLSEKAERCSKKILKAKTKTDLDKSWDETTADLEAEAAREIERLENIPTTYVCILIFF